MKKKNYSINEIQHILDNLKKEYKSRIVKAHSHEVLAREKSLFSYKKTTIKFLLEKKANIDENYKGKISSGLYEYLIPLINNAIETTLTSHFINDIEQAKRILIKKFILLDYKISENLEKEYIESIKSSTSLGDFLTIVGLYKRKDRAIIWLNKIYETDYSKDYFKESYQSFETPFKTDVKLAGSAAEIKSIFALGKSKIGGYKKLSDEYARIKKDYKRKIPSGHPEITVINSTENAISKARSTSEITRIMSIQMEKLRLLKE